MTLCDQDSKPVVPVRSVAGAALADLWHSPILDSALHHHATARYDARPLCPACY